MPVDLHLLHARGVAARRVVVEQRRRFGDRDVVVEAQLVGARQPRPVRRLVLTHQEERLLVVAPLFQPLDREVRRDVGDVAVPLHLAVRREELRLVVVALPGQHVPVVEAGRVGLQVPLADQRGLVAGALQPFRDVVLRPVEEVAVVAHAVRDAVLARQDHRATRRADRVGAVHLVEDHALPREAIEVRRAVDARAVGADRGGRVVVAEDEEDVGARGQLARVRIRSVGRSAVRRTGDERAARQEDRDLHRVDPT